MTVEPTTPTGRQLAAVTGLDIPVAQVEAEAAAQERERLRDELGSLISWGHWMPPYGTELASHRVYMDEDIAALLADPTT